MWDSQSFTFATNSSALALSAPRIGKSTLWSAITAFFHLIHCVPAACRSVICDLLVHTPYSMPVYMLAYIIVYVIINYTNKTVTIIIHHTWFLDISLLPVIHVYHHIMHFKFQIQILIHIFTEKPSDSLTDLSHLSPPHLAANLQVIGKFGSIYPDLGAHVGRQQKPTRNEFVCEPPRTQLKTLVKLDPFLQDLEIFNNAFGNHHLGNEMGEMRKKNNMVYLAYRNWLLYPSKFLLCHFLEGMKKGLNCISVLYV